MYITNKKVGETPLEALERFRSGHAKLKKEKLSYIGRLDPMAEGKMIIISGDENRERGRYLYFDKEYIAKFIIGAGTDSLDVLGLITSLHQTRSNGSFGPLISNKIILNAVGKLRKIKKQNYPWFSGKTISGVKMFDIFKSGKFEGIKRPINKIEVKKIFDIKIGNIGKKLLQKDILSKIIKVRGDFRQDEIKQSWLEFFSRTAQDKFQTISFVIKVSSGTFIRGFAENIGKEIKAPVFLYVLKRTKVFT